MFGLILLLFSIFVLAKYTDELYYFFTDGHYEVYKWPSRARKIYKLSFKIIRIFMIFITCWALMPLAKEIFSGFFHASKGEGVFVCIYLGILGLLFITVPFVIVFFVLLALANHFILYLLYDYEYIKEWTEKIRKKEEEREDIRVQKIGFWEFEEHGLTYSFQESMQKIAQMFFCPIIVDTNIWVDVKLDAFWESLRLGCMNSHSRIIIPPSVYDEIVKFKTNDDKSKRYLGRIGLKRIELFMNCDLLSMSSLSKIPNSSPYADADIISLSQSLARQNEKVFLITNDKDLGIRIRFIVNSFKELCSVYGVRPTEYYDKWEYRFSQLLTPEAPHK